MTDPLRSLLLELARYAWGLSCVCWPSMAAIAGALRKHPDTVRRLVRKAVALGFIDRIEAARGWMFFLPWKVEGSEAFARQGGDEIDPRGVAPAPGGGGPYRPPGSIEENQGERRDAARGDASEDRRRPRRGKGRKTAAKGKEAPTPLQNFASQRWTPPDAGLSTQEDAEEFKAWVCGADVHKARVGRSGLARLGWTTAAIAELTASPESEALAQPLPPAPPTTPAAAEPKPKPQTREPRHAEARRPGARPLAPRAGVPELLDVDVLWEMLVAAPDRPPVAPRGTSRRAPMKPPRPGSAARRDGG